MRLAALALLAALPWTPTPNVSSPHLFVDEPAIAFSRDGTGLATWQARDGLGASALVTYDAADLAPGAGAFGPQRPVREDLAVAPLTYAGSRTLAVTTGLAALYGRTGGSFGVPRPIPHGPDVRSIRLAANAQGDAAVAWFEDRGVTTDRVYVSLRRRNHPFAKPILLATGRIRSVSTAVSPSGDVLVAWDARGTIRARLKGSHDHGFRTTDTIRSAPTYFAAIRTAIAAGGAAYIAWSAQLKTEGGDSGPGYAEVAVRPAGAGRFRPAELLERDPATQQQGLLDITTGPATVVWTGWDGTHHRVRAAADAAGARFGFGAHQDLSPPGADAFEAALGASPDGRRLAVWTTMPADAGGGAISAATAPPGQPFGAPESVTEGPEARVPAAAYDERDHRWAIVWSNRPDGTTRTFLQAALRAAP
jgi:hypothetical protein